MSAWQGQLDNQQPWQPPGQKPRSSWQDPRFTNQNSNPPNSPVAHTRLGPAQAYDVPNAPNNSHWGVTYNQAQQPGYSSDNKPPLPPRPASGLAHTPSPAPVVNVPSWQTPPWQAPVQHTQLGYTQVPGYGIGQQWPPSTFPQQQSHLPSPYQPSPQSPAPPVPPPRPSAYQPQAQLDQTQWSHQQHSRQNASPSKDPRSQGQPYSFRQTYQPPQLYQVQQAYQIQQPYEESRPIQNQPPSLSQAQTTQVDQQAPVSPVETHEVLWNSTSQAQISSQNSRIESGPSALGAGGPSDWEHFQGSIGDVEDEGTSAMYAQSQWENPSLNDGYAELPADSSQQASQFMDPTPPAPAVSEVPIRKHSVSPEPNSEGLRRTGTIDGVIQAWNKPLGGTTTGAESRKSSISTLDRSRRDGLESTNSSPRQASQSSQAYQLQASALEHDSPNSVAQEQPASPSRIPARQNSLAPPPLSTKTIEVDPYSDLGPEYRASLARYAAMLRKEEAASDEERYKFFKSFVLKESRLRSILYGVESDDEDVFTLPLKRVKKTERETVQADASPIKAPSASPPLPAQVKTSKAPNSTPALSPKLTVKTSSPANEDPYLVVEQENESEYSPGGRPRMSRTVPRRTASHPPPKSSPNATSSPSDYAPILVDEVNYSPSNKRPVLRHDLPERPGTAPLAVRNGVMNEPIKFQPTRPAYTPFRYAEGPQRGSEPLVAARPAYQAYSALRHQSVDSGRIMAKSTADITGPVRRETVASPTGNNVRREHEEAFLGLIREKSRAYRGGKRARAPSVPNSDLMPFPDLIDRQTQAMNGLHKIVPTMMPQQRRPGLQTVEAQHAMEKYPDIFSWIPETVVTWDRDNRVIRKKQEDERQARQEESEKNIDALFNEHEIGYSDIGQLESDFKLAEATRKYEEDVQELESFTDKVFKPVTERLKEEVFELNAQCIRAVDVLELEADSGSQYLHGKGDRASRSAAMDVLLALYNKLQIRHVKMAEAHYERERRRKKLELSVLYTNGDTAAMKKLEQEFNKAERQQTLQQALEKDSRANKLMDTFDRATVRGLGDNQQFVDDVVTKLQNMNGFLQERPEHLTEPLLAGLQESLRSTEELLDYVADDSKSLLTISNQADDMLNKADYDVSVAEARVANATPESMKTLEDEKNKEDERIKAEADTRMGSVAKGPENASSLLRNIMKRSGDNPQHQDRVQKALEAAKVRNASKMPVE